MVCSLVARQRYRLVQSRWGQAELEAATGSDALEDIRREPFDTGYGVLEHDDFYPRTGTDVIVLGDAISTRGPVREHRVRVAAGPYDVTLAVIGDRVWERSWSSGTLSPSPPIPFERMPITYSRAYGGTTQTENGPLSWVNNPSGLGYILQEGQAEGVALPNIEDPAAPINSWQSQPDPVGLAPYPMQWGLRLLAIATVSEDGVPTLHPEKGMFNKAHPRLAGAQLRPGDQVRITGMSPQGEISFILPQSPVYAEIRLEDVTLKRDPHLEEVLVDIRPESRDVWIELTWRKVFDYRIIPHQARETSLHRHTAGR